MKQLTCDLCGSNDLIKNEGVFVCQSCGSKYSVEEARRMVVDGVVEVKGTVTIDDSQSKEELIENYLHLAQVAFKNSEFELSINYCDKILETNSKNYLAFSLKAKCIGSGYGKLEDKTHIKNARAGLMYAQKAVELAPTSEKYSVAEEIYGYISNFIHSEIMKCTSIDFYHDIKLNELMLFWLSLLDGIPNLKKELLETELDNCILLKSKKNTGLVLYMAKIKFNKRVDYDVIFREKLQPKIDLEYRRSKEGIQKYWLEHADERAELDSKKASASIRRDELLNEKKTLVNTGEHLSVQREMDTLSVQLKKLGLFKQAEKNEILKEIDRLRIQLNEFVKKMEQDVAAIQAKIDAEEKIISQINLELTRERG